MKVVGTDPTEAPWHKHRLKILAAATLALLAWLAYYLEYLPISRSFTPADAALTRITDDEAVRLEGVASGDLGSFRSVTARRVRVTLPATAVMSSPELSAFQAKAARERDAVGITCGDEAAVLDARPAENENATVQLALDSASPRKAQASALLIGKPDPNQYKNGIVVRADQAKMTVSVAMNRNDANPRMGTMTLCRSGRAATLGRAEFELAPGQPLVVEFLDPQGSADLAPAVFDMQGRIPVTAISGGRYEEDVPFERERIACGTSKDGTKLWARFMPDVGLSDCSPKSLFVTGIDIANGKLSVAKRPAYFRSFDDKKDSAHYVSRTLSNPILQQLLIGGLISGMLIPWALRQFRGERNLRATGSGGRRRKKASRTSR